MCTSILKPGIQTRHTNQAYKPGTHALHFRELRTSTTIHDQYNHRAISACIFVYMYMYIHVHVYVHVHVRWYS